jgi:hypothetical protein
MCTMKLKIGLCCIDRVYLRLSHHGYISRYLTKIQLCYEAIDIEAIKVTTREMS